MKTVFPFLTVLILEISVYSCSHRKQDVLLPELNHVETIMNQYPDSALNVLKQMKMPKSSDTLNHATWCLFLVQAKYKNYIQQPSDSLINIAYDYFMKQDDPQRKALVLYLEGAINAELNEAEKAVRFYLKAIDEVEKTTNYQLGHLIYAGLGEIYIYRRLYDYAENALEKSRYYADLSENKRSVVNSLLLIGRLCSVRQNWDKAIEYYRKAIDASDNNGDEKFSDHILLEMSSVYGSKGDYRKALEYAQKGFKLKKENDPDYYQGFLTIGKIYCLMANVDSAYYYYDKALLSENLNIRRSVYGGLFLLNRNEKKYKEALDYMEQYQLYSDSIQKIDHANALAEIQERYNKERLLNQGNQLRMERDQTIRAGLLILILLFCITAIIIYNYQRRLLQKERIIQRNEEQLRLYTLKVRENAVLISRNEGRIQELSIEIEQNQETKELLEEQKNAIVEIRKQNEALRKENEAFQGNISRYTSVLQEKSKGLELLNALTEENLRLKDRERFLSNQLLKETKILHDLKISPKYLDFARWEEVKEAIDRLYENYTKRLIKELPSLTENDLQICCLIKLHLAIPEMATLLGISPTSVSKRKLRLKERIVQELGEPLGGGKTLDLWLWEY